MLENKLKIVYLANERTSLAQNAQRCQELAQHELSELFLLEILVAIDTEALKKKENDRFSSQHRFSTAYAIGSDEVETDTVGRLVRDACKGADVVADVDVASVVNAVVCPKVCPHRSIVMELVQLPVIIALERESPNKTIFINIKKKGRKRYNTILVHRAVVARACTRRNHLARRTHRQS